LNVGKVGECQGEIKHPSTLHVLATNDGIEVTAPETLDQTKVTKGASSNGVTSYGWNDRDLSVKVQNDPQQGLSLTFSSAGSTLFSVKCLPVGETGSCTKE
jgi:hypothetical protein